MIRINENYTKLKASYLFSDIAKRVSAYVAANPTKPVIRLGIGDVLAHRFLDHQPLGTQGEGRNQVFMTEIFADAQHDAICDGAQGLEFFGQ